MLAQRPDAYIEFDATADGQQYQSRMCLVITPHGSALVLQHQRTAATPHLAGAPGCPNDHVVVYTDLWEPMFYEPPFVNTSQ